MGKRVFIMNFKEDSKSYQAYSEIKDFHADKKIQIEQMAIIKNSEEEKLQIKALCQMTLVTDFKSMNI